MSDGKTKKVDAPVLAVPVDAVPTRVVVVGAGIAGLTAAHELAMRGFEVEVVEPEDELRRQGDPRNTTIVGGMARTQYADAPTAKGRHRLGQQAFIPLTESAAPCLDFSAESLEKHGTGDLEKLHEWIDANPLVKRWATFSVVGKTEEAVAGLVEVLEAVVSDIPFTKVVDESIDEPRILFGAIRVPAEHGFRFFPSFYRHMFDTMKRIPKAALATNLGPDGKPGMVVVTDADRTVFDNLVAAPEFRFGLDSGNSWSLRRRPPKSVDELRKNLTHLLDDMGYDPSEGATLATRLLRYLLTSKERRQEELEDITWLDYVEVERFSGRLVKHLESAPQILAAMNAKDGDARTIGSIAMQLLLDQLRDQGNVDALLNGPTTEALFNPWKRFLESAGVTFSKAKLIGFCGARVPPQGGTIESVYARPKFDENVSPADYYVVTIPVDAFQALWNDETPVESTCCVNRGHVDTKIAGMWTPRSPACGRRDRACGHQDRGRGHPDREHVDTEQMT